jgi:hypothetical protein
MALNGIGEPAPTLIQVATQAVKIELFTQWQTYHNGVHMNRDTFDSIDFRALALAVITATGITVTADDVADNAVEVTHVNSFSIPKDGNLPVPGLTPRHDEDGMGRKVAYPKPGSDAWNEHMKQVQG